MLGIYFIMSVLWYLSGDTASYHSSPLWRQTLRHGLFVHCPSTLKSSETYFVPF